MESAELLDLLGNETRRRILSLLARKPCYVTEISDVTGVSPKAVIDHLERLQAAGLIEYRSRDNRRKYFSIVQSQRLEITIGPHEFGTKNGYLPSHSIDSHHFSSVDLDLGVDEPDSDPASLVRDLERLESVAAELSCAQRFVHAEMHRRYDRLRDQLFEDGSARLGMDILEALDGESLTTGEIARRFSVTPRAVERCLARLGRAGLVRQTAAGWRRIA